MSRPVGSLPGDRCFPSAQGVPFQVATGSFFMLPLPSGATSKARPFASWPHTRRVKRWPRSISSRSRIRGGSLPGPRSPTLSCRAPTRCRAHRRVSRVPDAAETGPGGAGRQDARRGYGRTPPRSAGRPTKRLSFTASSAGANLIVRQLAGRCVVAVVLDLGVRGFRFSARRLSDTSYGTSEADGRLPSRISEPAIWRAVAGCRRRWRRLSRLVDLVALCEMLTHHGLPDAPALELGGADPRDR